MIGFAQIKNKNYMIFNPKSEDHFYVETTTAVNSPNDVLKALVNPKLYIEKLNKDERERLIHFCQTKNYEELIKTLHNKNNRLSIKMINGIIEIYRLKIGTIDCMIRLYELESIKKGKTYNLPYFMPAGDGDSTQVELIYPVIMRDRMTKSMERCNIKAMKYIIKDCGSSYMNYIERINQYKQVRPSM